MTTVSHPHDLHTYDLRPVGDQPAGPHVLDDANGLICTRVAWVADIVNPLLTPPWDVPAISAEEVLEAVTQSRFIDPLHPSGHPPEPTMNCRDCDIARIAHFVAYPWPDEDPHPIQIDVGLGTYVPQWPVVDGNHRLAAALVRNDTYITVSAAGDWERCEQVLLHGVSLWDAP